MNDITKYQDKNHKTKVRCSIGSTLTYHHYNIIAKKFFLNRKTKINFQINASVPDEQPIRKKNSSSSTAETRAVHALKEEKLA